MKNLIYVAIIATVLAIACTKESSKQIAVEKSCHCLICEASDSLLAGNYAHDNLMWYDSLTTLICEELSTSENIEASTKDMWASPSVREAFYEGYDGLCGDCYDTLGTKIDKFYDVIEEIEKKK